MNDEESESTGTSEPAAFSLGRLVMALVVGAVLGSLAAGLSWLFYEPGVTARPEPTLVGTTVSLLVVVAGLWVGVTADNLRRAIRIGMGSMVVVVFVADACGAPVWATVLLGLVFAVVGFMLERKKEEVGDFSTFLDD